MGLALGSGLETGARQPRWYAHPFNRADLYRLAAALTWLPRAARLALARRIGRLAPRWMPAEHAVVRRSLAVFTGATDGRLDALTGQLFAEFAMFFSDLVANAGRPPARLMAEVDEVEGIERLRPLTGGLVSLTAHVGNWDLAGRLLAGRSARVTHVVVAPEEAAALERWVRRAGAGVRFVTRDRATVSVGLVAALRRGQVVAVQGDRALGTRGDAVLPFFGRPAPFPLGPFVLAAAAGVPMVPAFCVMGPQQRYVVRVAEPIRVARGDEVEAARQWIAILEATVRAYPTQWFNFFDIWSPFGVAADAAG